MKKYLKKLKDPKILIPLLIIIIILIPFVSYLLGNVTSSRYPNWSRRFKDIAQYSSFGLLKEKEVVKVQEEEEEKEINLVTVSPSEIDIINKRVSIYRGELETVYMFSALLKNNSEYGIPKVEVESIRIYDENNNLVGEKTDYTSMVNINLVKGGEYPFSFEIVKQEEDWNPKSFDLEITVPEFKVNKKAVRLDVVNLELRKREDKQTLGVIEKGGFNYLNYIYDITIKNNTDRVIGDIYYISFLKYKDLVLSTIEDSCCREVYFEKEQESFSLNKPDIFSTLQPGQEETITIEMGPRYSLYEKGINEDEIELVFYPIGIIQ